MDLVSPSPFWPILNGLPRSWPGLRQTVRCEVAILGAGITGALVADTLTAEGRDVVVVDRRNVGAGSTSASTALVQYELDVPLLELARMRGQSVAERAYQACARGVELIGQRADSLSTDVGFRRRSSVFLASDRKAAKWFPREAEARRAAGLEVDCWTAADVATRFSFEAPAALHSTQAAEVDPYRLTYALLARAERQGARIFDRVPPAVLKEPGPPVMLQCEEFTVLADWLVVATGYEATSWLPAPVVDLRSSFALVSEPLTDFPGWWERCLLWESKNPYLYLRTTADHRALVGGLDDPFRNPRRRDALVPRKARQLEDAFRAHFPEIAFEPAYAWGGTFGETQDGLAYIGASTERPRILFACGFGGNGITFGALAAEIVAAAIRREVHPDGDIFKIEGR